MITKKAYAGSKFVYRAYFDGQLIWDYGEYTAGAMDPAVESGSAAPMVEEPTPIQLHTEATIDGTGQPVVWELDAIQAHADATLTGEAEPHAAEAVNGYGRAVSSLIPMCAVSTYSQVFANGRATAKIKDMVAPHAVNIEYGAGTTDGDIIASLCPTVDEFLQMVMSARATADGSVIPQIQEPEHIIAQTAAKLTATGAAAALPVHHVTFVVDGVEKHTTSVIHGNACPDPVEAGVFDEPTKEMTPQHTFDYSGWALTDGGEADDSVLTNITADIVLYAAFTQSVRYYDISFYDGGTLMNTKSYAYGETPSYIAVKPGYISEGWTPEPVPVTKETHYTAVWRQISDFAEASWDDIAMISESGNAESCFNLGDEKIVPIHVKYTYKTGTYTSTTVDYTVDVPFVIVHFGDHECEDGSIAGITLLSKHALYNEIFGNTYNQIGSTVKEIGKKYGWADSTARQGCNEKAPNYFPSEVVNHIKAVKKLSHPVGGATSAVPTETIDRIWIPSITEYGLSNGYTCKNQGFKFDGISHVGVRAYSQNKTTISTSYVTHGTRSASVASGSYFSTVIQSGGSTTYAGASIYRIGFCI